MSEDFLARHPEVRIEQVRRPITGVNDLTAPSYSCRECESGKHDQCSGREYGFRWSFDCPCAKKTPHFERVEVAQVPLALLAELTKETIYIVGHDNGDDMCGGYPFDGYPGVTFEYKVNYGYFANREEAEAFASKLNENTYDSEKRFFEYGQDKKEKEYQVEVKRWKALKDAGFNDRAPKTFKREKFMTFETWKARNMRELFEVEFVELHSA